MTTNPPRKRRSLTQLKAIPDDVRRAKAAEEFITVTRTELADAIQTRRDALRHAREERGLTRPELARQTGIAEHTVHGDLR